MENIQEFTQEQNIQEKNQIYYSSQSEHSLIIHQIPTNSTYQQQKLHRCLDHVRQLTRSRKWKHKEGRDSSHSYWSRTHGPRGTTHGTSVRRPWLWMVSRRGFLLPAGCQGGFSRQPRSLNGGGGSIEGSSRKSDRYYGFPPRGL